MLWNAGRGCRALRSDGSLTELQKLERRDLQRITLEIAAYINTQMRVLVGLLESIDNKRVPLRIELQEFMVAGHDPKAALLALKRTFASVRVRIFGGDPCAGDIKHGSIVKCFGSSHGYETGHDGGHQ